MHHALFAVHPDMRLQTEVPLLSLPGLMHLRVALAGLVLGGGRRMDNGRIHDRTRRNADALGLQMHVHSLQHQTAQFVLLQQMAEAADGCLVRRRRNPEIHANESAQRCRFVQRLFHPGIRQVEPLLNKVRPQHDREAHRLPSVTRLRVVRTHQSLHRRPRNYTLHLLQKQLPPTLPTVLLKHRLTCQTLLLHPVHLATIRLINQAADAELVQRFPKAVIEYFTQVVPPKFYVAKADYETEQRSLLSVDADIRILNRTRERLSKSLTIAGPQLNSASFEAEISEIVRQLTALNAQQELYRAESVSLQESLATADHQIAITTDALK